MDENERREQLDTEANPVPSLYGDIFLLSLLGIIVFFVSSAIELNEKLSAITRPLEDWQLDEVPFVLIVTVLMVVAVLAKRTKQLRRQTMLQLDAQRKLYLALEENKRLSRRNIEIQELERRTIARELHDEFGQSMNAIMIDGVSIRDSVGKDSDIYAQASAIVDTSEKVFSGVRGLLKQLRPVALDELGLSSALEHMIDEWSSRFDDISWETNIDLPGDFLDETINITIYRLVQETLTNIVRHSDAEKVSISVVKIGGGDNVHVEVVDDGTTQEVPKSTSGIGLLGLRERVEGLDGEFDVRTVRPHGFKVSAKFMAR